MNLIFQIGNLPAIVDADCHTIETFGENAILAFLGPGLTEYETFSKHISQWKSLILIMRMEHTTTVGVENE